jgi:hypothetical protein
MITHLQLPFQFDPLLLKSGLASIQPEEWTPHYNERDYGGDWSGVALRSLNGNSRHLHAKEDGANAYSDTEVLLRCSYLQQVLSAFTCPLKCVRLLRLASGSVIREHSDPALGFEDGEVRIHIPIQTNPGVEFCVMGERLLFEEGSCYYVNVSLPHRVSNRGDEHRIHLVIDADVNEWLRAVFRNGRQVLASHGFPRGVEEFRTAVLSDDVLQQRLHATEDRREFLATATGLARELGFNVEESELETGRCIPTREAGTAPNHGLGWLPVDLRLQADQPVAEWLYFGSRRFVEPFFEKTVRAALRNPFARAFRHEATLREKAGTAPSGFIFHMSRCGSTLVAQTLASIDRTLVISEASPIDAAIRTNNVDSLRNIVHALGQRRFGETHYFVKFDAWHIHNLRLIREAFPDTPWIFVYRDPVEVLVSQLRSPGQQALPGAMDPGALGLSLSDITGLGRQEWCARVLANFCTSALAFRDDPRSLFVDYRQLPGAIWGLVAQHFSLHLSGEELARMQSAAQLDAKSPARNFESDCDSKQREATGAIHELAAIWLNPLYTELQTITRYV